MELGEKLWLVKQKTEDGLDVDRQNRVHQLAAFVHRVALGVVDKIHLFIALRVGRIGHISRAVLWRLAGLRRLDSRLESLADGLFGSWGCGRWWRWRFCLFVLLLELLLRKLPGWGRRCFGFVFWPLWNAVSGKLRVERIYVVFLVITRQTQLLAVTVVNLEKKKNDKKKLVWKSSRWIQHQKRKQMRLTESSYWKRLLPIATAPANSSAYPSTRFATNERESRKLCRAMWTTWGSAFRFRLWWGLHLVSLWLLFLCLPCKLCQTGIGLKLNIDIWWLTERKIDAVKHQKTIQLTYRHNVFPS